MFREGDKIKTAEGTTWQLRWWEEINRWAWFCLSTGVWGISQDGVQAPKGGVMDSRFVEKKLVELYPTAAHYVIMQEFTGLRTAECCTRINEARFMLVLQDPDAALALAREYKEWKDKQKEG